MFADAAGPCIRKYIKADREFLLYPHENSGGIPFRVQVRSADNPDHLRGPSVGFIWADESSLMTRECFNIMRGRTLDCNGIIFMTTTPRGKDWLYDEVYLKSQTDPRFAVVRSKTDENPFLSYSDVQSFRNTYPAEFARRELDAEFINFEGLVYKAFDPLRHILGEVRVTAKGGQNQVDDLFIGMDPGYSDPFAIVWIAKKDGKFIIVDEYYERWKTPEQVIGYIKSHPYWMMQPRVWCDPSSPEVVSQMNQAGVRCFSASRIDGQGDLLDGIHKVSSLIDSGRLYVAQKCVNTVKEFGAYAYPNREGRNIDEKPIDFHNHAMDAIRYAIRSEMAYKNIQPFANNDDGFHDVVRSTKEDFDREFAAMWYQDNKPDYDAAESGAFIDVGDE
jgi:phage terminase large subunit